jgi:hypothetical protein
MWHIAARQYAAENGTINAVYLWFARCKVHQNGVATGLEKTIR